MGTSKLLGLDQVAANPEMDKKRTRSNSKKEDPSTEVAAAKPKQKKLKLEDGGKSESAAMNSKQKKAKVEDGEKPDSVVTKPKQKKTKLEDGEKTESVATNSKQKKAKVEDGEKRDSAVTKPKQKKTKLEDGEKTESVATNSKQKKAKLEDGEKTETAAANSKQKKAKVEGGEKQESVKSTDPKRNKLKPEDGQKLEGGEDGSLRRPKRAAACTDFKNKSVRVSEKSMILENKKVHVVEDEIAAISLTSGQDNPLPNRRLTDFVFHDADGTSQPVEMLEVSELFISGTILNLEESTEKSEKEKGIRCEGFGRIESWAISGYEEGSPVFWVTTEFADYECIKPAAAYKKLYGLFYEKGRTCIEIYKKLCKSAGGNPEISLDELLASVTRSMRSSKNFPSGASIRESIISWGSFIYDQLIGLDENRSDNDCLFREIPALAALRDESNKSVDPFPGTMVPSNTSLRIRDGEKVKTDKPVKDEEDEDAKMARVLQEKENWNLLGQRNRRKNPVSSSSKYYIKINEDEIANDYPLPAYYKTTVEETDEYLIFDNGFDNKYDELPRHMLHNWSLYNSDSRLISLELLPMKPCADIDVTIFGSGTMTEDDGSGFCLDSESGSNSSGPQNVEGIPIYLSAIKEWMIEFGSSMVFVSIRTDMAWYRLGKPSKQYAAWYDPVLKTARLGISVITLLKEQSRVSRLNFQEVIKKISDFDKDNPSYIASNPEYVERYIVVHGQIILQQFAEYPDESIKKSSFVTGLHDKMEQRHHTKWLVKKKGIIQKEENLNPRAGMQPVVSKRKAMPATTTKLINRIWGDYYSNYSPEEADQVKKDEEIEEEEQEENGEEDEEVDEEKIPVIEESKTSEPACEAPKVKKSSSKEIKWEGKEVGKVSGGKILYNNAFVRGDSVVVGGSVMVEKNIYFVEYMFEDSKGKKFFHGRLMVRGCNTVLGNTANEREVFLSNGCEDIELGDISQTVVVEIRVLPWGHQHRNANANLDRVERAKAEERKSKNLPVEYFCKSLYSPERGAFFCIKTDLVGLGNGICESCKINELEKAKEELKVDHSTFKYEGIEYSVNDYVYVGPDYFAENGRGNGTFKGGRNVGLKPYVICSLMEIILPKASAKQSDPEAVKVKMRRFFRPEDISPEKAYRSDIREVYYSEEIETVPIAAIEGKCEVRRKRDLSSVESSNVFEHKFFCEYLYDPENGSLKLLPAHIKLSPTKEAVDEVANRRRKGKSVQVENDSELTELREAGNVTPRLATLDIFAGCGGLSQGLQEAGASNTKWAIEYEEPAGDAFNLNHPEALTFVQNCNVVLRAIMTACGDSDDCISTSEADELVAKLDQKQINDLPRPGQVDFINGGPPCQGFSGMNRFNQSTWSKVQCEMILSFLSFAEYFRPKYFLLENVRNFVSFNKGQTFRLTIASLLEMGYQVRFGILEAGAFGVSQSRKRAFIWAASPQEKLPEWPEPMHVFAGPELRINLNDKAQFAAVKSTASGAPFRSITVRDTIGELPPVGNGASVASMEYKSEPVSWFQKKIRGDMRLLVDHISKEMNELNLIRCQRIPKRPGADWRDLPEEKVRLSTGQMVDLIPWCLPNTANRHNQWKGLFGRLDWEGNFPTSITDPQPMGKVGMCFHPEQDRILTVRECARSQGFPDDYKFSGNIIHKHRQIGNAVPPPLAFALGTKLREAIQK